MPSTLRQRTSSQSRSRFYTIFLVIVVIFICANVILLTSHDGKYETPAVSVTNIKERFFQKIESNKPAAAAAKQENNDDYERQIAEQRRQIEDLQIQLTAAQEKSNRLKESLPSHPPPPPTKTTPTATHSSSFCSSFFPDPTPTASYLWNTNLGHIFNSSRHPRDPNFNFHDWNAILLHSITTRRLQKSIATLPHPSDTRFLLNILKKRYEHVVNGGPPADPLQILVMGGSVTLGNMCMPNPQNFKVGSFMRLGCAWPFRLGKFLNAALGFEAVAVENMALGGTNTEMASFIYEFGLLPEDMKRPDVVINAYGTNDVHVLSMESAKMKNQTLEEAVFEMMQGFVRVVMGSRDCERRPVLMFFDDYLGNEQREILTTMAFNKIMKMLAGYYGFMSVSYGDAMRDLVYGDTKEAWFHPGWYENGEFRREIHLPMGAHQVISWMFAYNFLNAALLFCSELDDVDFTVPKGQHNYQSINGLPKLTTTETIPGAPIISTDEIVPPMLLENTSLVEITDLWKKSQTPFLHCRSSEKKTSRPSCLYAWIANLKEMKEEDILEKKMKEIIVSNEGGWKAEKVSNKLGFIPTKRNGKPLHLEYKNVAAKGREDGQSITTATLMVMKSYGEKWEGSKVEVVISRVDGNGKKDELERVEIDGIHNSETSVTYTLKFPLKRAIAVGESLQVLITLIGGETFKITGMAFC